LYIEGNSASGLKTSGTLAKKLVFYLPKEVVDFASLMENVLEAYQHSYDDKAAQVCLNIRVTGFKPL